MKNTLQAWLARCLLACGLAGSPFGLLAQSNIEVTTTFGLGPDGNATSNYVLNLGVNLHPPGAVVKIQHYPEGVFQANYTTTRTVNQYNASIPVPGQGTPSQGVIRAYSNNTAATTFTADFLYTVATGASLRNYPKITDRMGKVSFTPSADDRLTPYEDGWFLERVMVVSSDYPPLLKNIPRGWQPVSDLVAVTATTPLTAITSFKRNGILEIGYQDWLLAPADEMNMSLFRWNFSTMVWEKMACPAADTLNNRVSVNINRTGVYTILSMLSVHKAESVIDAGQQQIQVAASSLQTSAAIDSLGVLLARGGTEIILAPGFFTYQGSQFDTQLTGTYCVGTIGSGTLAREAFAESGPEPQAVAPGNGLSSAVLAAAQLGDNRVAVVHPNPAGAALTLTYRVRSANDGPVGFPGVSLGPQPVSVRLFDLTGRLKAVVLDGVLKEPGIHHQDVPVGTLPPAMYVLELQVGNEPKRSFKVVKQ